MWNHQPLKHLMVAGKLFRIQAKKLRPCKMRPGLDVVLCPSSCKTIKWGNYTVGECRILFITHSSFAFTTHPSFPLFNKGIAVRFFSRENYFKKKDFFGGLALLLVESIFTSIYTLQRHKDTIFSSGSSEVRGI